MADKDKPLLIRKTLLCFVCVKYVLVEYLANKKTGTTSDVFTIPIVK